MKTRTTTSPIELEERKSKLIIAMACMALAVDLAGLTLDFIPSLQRYAVVVESLTLFFILPILRIRGGWPAVAACLSAYFAAFNLDLALNNVLGIQVPGLTSLTFILPNIIAAIASTMALIASLMAKRQVRPPVRRP